MKGVCVIVASICLLQYYNVSGGAFAAETHRSESPRSRTSQVRNKKKEEVVLIRAGYLAILTGREHSLIVSQRDIGRGNPG